MTLQLMSNLYPTGSNVSKDVLKKWLPGPMANVQGHGAVGDGSTDDHTAFSAAQTAAVASGAGAVFVPPGNYALDSSLTLSSGAAMQLSIGSQITLASGAGLTVNGLLVGPRQELFPGRGRVTLADHITSPEWWGVTRAAPTEHTIASGAITASADILSIDTESDAASDDLDTITAGSDGDVLLLRCEASARVVTVKHGTGNIWLDSDTDADLDDLKLWLALKYSSTYSKWIEVGRLTDCDMEGDQAAGLSLGGAAYYDVGTSGGDLVALQASNAKLPPGVYDGGNVVQVRYSGITPASGVTPIPIDDTPPSITEGTEVWSYTITPQDASNKIIIQGCPVVSCTQTQTAAFALFRGSTYLFANTKKGTNDHPWQFNINVVDSPGSISEQTYSIRAGVNGGNWYWGDGTVAVMGSAANGGQITLTEIQGS